MTQSLPVRECGLKLILCPAFITSSKVTPRAGVWIETAEAAENHHRQLVTPRAGVWIETVLRLSLSVL